VRGSPAYAASRSRARAADPGPLGTGSPRMSKSVAPLEPGPCDDHWNGSSPPGACHGRDGPGENLSGVLRRSFPAAVVDRGSFSSPSGGSTAAYRIPVSRSGPEYEPEFSIPAPPPAGMPPARPFPAGTRRPTSPCTLLGRKPEGRRIQARTGRPLRFPSFLHRDRSRCVPPYCRVSLGCQRPPGAVNEYQEHMSRGPV
jgi:hypothetical protein